MQLLFLSFEYTGVVCTTGLYCTHELYSNPQWKQISQTSTIKVARETGHSACMLL